MTDDVLIVFVKNPEIGKVKTRLAKTIGESQALGIYFKLLNNSFDITEKLNQDVVIYYNNYIDTEDRWHNSKYKKYLQSGRSLGDKMSNAIEEQLKNGYKKVCLVGSDIYELTSTIINQGFEILNAKDVVLGPAVDGGYYLIGMKNPSSTIFELTNWSTDTVFSETVSNIDKLNLSYGITEELNDIDTIEDLKKTDLMKFISLS